MPSIPPRPPARRTVLVTGGTGFLGSHLVRRLAAGGYDVLLAKRSTSSTARIQDVLPGLRTFDLDRTTPEEAFAQNRVDVVLHCATDYGLKKTPPSRVIEANLALPLKLLELAVENGVKVFVNTDTILDKRVSFYSLSKRQFRDWLAVFSPKLVGINVALEHFFGPSDDATKFVSRMVAEVVRGADRIALTPGEQKRDFIYIDDVVDALMTLIDKSPALPNGFHSHEVGTGRKLSIREFMTLLVRLADGAGTRLDFGAIPYRENEVMDTDVDVSGLRALGWAARVPLEEGLRRTIEFERSRMVGR